MAEDERTKKLASVLDAIVDIERLTSDARSLKEKLLADDPKDETHVDEARRLLAELRTSVDAAHRSFDEHFAVKKEDDEEEKPSNDVKVGTIKLVDLSKLMDPNRAAVARRPSTPVVILSDSETEERPAKKDKKKGAVVANGVASRRRPQRTAARQVRAALSKIVDSDSSSSSVSSLSSDGEAKQGRRQAKKGGKKAPAFDEVECVKGQKDAKFACKCTVRLTRVPAEKLKEDYNKKIRDSEMTRLFNLKSLKRSRKQRQGSDLSDSRESSPATSRKKPPRSASKKKKVTSDDDDDETPPKAVAADVSVDDLANDSTVVMTDNEGDEILKTIRSDDEKKSSHDESSDADDERSKSKKKDKTSKKESKKKKEDKNAEKNKIDDKETAASTEPEKEKTKKKKDEADEKPEKTEEAKENAIEQNAEIEEKDEDAAKEPDEKKDKEQEQEADTSEKNKGSDEEKNEVEEQSKEKSKKKQQKGKKAEEDVTDKEAGSEDAANNSKESEGTAEDSSDKEETMNESAEKVDEEEKSSKGKKKDKKKDKGEEEKKETDTDKDKTDVEENAEKSKDSDKEEEKQDEKIKRKRNNSSDSSKSESKKKKSKKKIDSSDSDKDGDQKKDSDTNSEDEKEKKKKKSKWRRDKLLTSVLSSESEEEARAKFDKKKEKNRKAKSDDDDDDEDDKVVKLKRSSKKSKKKRVLTDSEYEGEKDSPSENSEKSASSDDDDDDDEAKKKAEEKKKSRRRIKRVNDSSEDDEKKSTRKHIRKVLTKDSLAESTLQAEKDEAERKARIIERQKKYNNLFEPDKLEKTTLDKVVLDFNEETEEELLKVDPVLVKNLKPHQGKGIQFMWDACFESLERAKSDKGSGCILAHCMGLGKTLQVITLLHTLLANEEKTGIKKALVVCPLSTVLNWVAEFKKWLPDDDVVEVYDLVAYKQNRERLFQVKEWHRVGGVMVMGYDMFRNLSREKGNRLPKKMRNELQTMLVDPGPDMVVCDEGHLLKNEKTSISICMNRLRTLRRIVLTGTPLQNNLKEYWCMVQFVKPNLLGTYKEYLNRFVNPITNGQYTDSTQFDIQLMRKRSHVLHKMLDGIVQRRDYSVLAPFLPPKYEYVLFISLTETQVKLYKHYMDNFARRQSGGGRSSFLFVDFQELQRICTHPRVLLDKSIENKLAQEKKELYDDEESEGSLKDFIDDEVTDEDSSSSNSSSGSEKGGSSAGSEKKEPKTKGRRRTRAMAQDDPLDVDEEPEKEEPSEWWRQFTAGDELDNIVHSGKLHLLFEILQQCELMGDKVLVFSQSLYSLNVIEYFLQKIDEATQNGDNSTVSGYTGSWALGLDYFRLDGSSSCDNRAAWCKTFNDPENSRARLFLISTRAGGLGINLVAANRVIIFDVSWNPSHDIQSIYRVYRFGQSKPSYIYRFVTMGTMEMKIYERQVMKQSISKRVIDEQQIDRHYNQNDLAELYKFEPEPEEERPLPMVPKDVLLGELVHNFDKLIYKYHEHQSLLENKQDEELNEEERKAAWEEFENEKKNRGNLNALSGDSISMYFGGTPVHQIVASITSIIKRDHPDMNVMQINNAIPMVIQEMKAQLTNGDATIHAKIMTELRAIQYQQQKKMQEIYQFQKMFEKYQQQMSSGPNPMDPSSILAQFQRQFGLNTYPSASNRVTPAPMPRNIDPNEVVRIDD